MCAAMSNACFVSHACWTQTWHPKCCVRAFQLICSGSIIIIMCRNRPTHYRNNM